MALFCGKLLRSTVSKNLALAAGRRGYPGDGVWADPIDHATGLEKREMLAMKAGNDDPYNMKARKRGPGTKAEPNLIPSCNDSRIIGCVCEEDSSSVKFMWVHKGEPKRCECGYWFKLVYAAPL